MKEESHIFVKILLKKQDEDLDKFIFLNWIGVIFFL